MSVQAFIRSILGGMLGLGLVIALFFSTGLTFIDLREFLQQLNWSAFAGIIVCTFFYVILGGMKWHLIAGMRGPRAFFYTYYTGQAMLIGQFLPPPVAIAINRATVMKFKQNTALKKGFFNALYDMGFDFLVAAVLIPASFLQLMYRFGWDQWLMTSAAILLAVSAFLVCAPDILSETWLAKIGLSEARRRGVLSKRIIALLMILSTARFALVIIRLWLGAMAIGLALPFAIVAYAAPPATMSSLLVLTPANLGIAEWSWAWLLTLWGIPVAAGTLYGVSFRILVLGAQLIVSAFCWILYTVGNRH